MKKSEINALIAGLRCWQAILDGGRPDLRGILDIATDGGSELLDSDGIEDLIERINFDFAPDMEEEEPWSPADPKFVWTDRDLVDAWDALGDVPLNYDEDGNVQDPDEIERLDEDFVWRGVLLFPKGTPRDEVLYSMAVVRFHVLAGDLSAINHRSE